LLGSAMLAAFCLSCFAQDVPETDQWGTRFNSAHAALVAKETGQTFLNGRTIVSYSLLASGLPEDKDYILWNWMAGQPPRAMADAFVNDEGKIVSRRADPAHHIAEDPINLKLLGGRGEVKRFALISTDDEFRAFVDIVPFPLEVKNGNCRLSVETMVPDYSVVTVRASGFFPDEHLAVTIKSSDEGAQISAQAGHDGSYVSVIAPLVKGKQSGKASIAITSTGCKLKVEFPWGQGAYHIE